MRSRAGRGVRLRPAGEKDWNEILVTYGSDHLRSLIEEKIANAFRHRKLSRCYKPPPPPINCPFCFIDLKIDETEVLIESFCPLGCSFVDYRFTDNRKAVFGAVCALYDQLTAEECQAITDALEERAAILRYEFDLVYEEEAEAAEQDILPRIVAGNLKAWNSPVK